MADASGQPPGHGVLLGPSPSPADIYDPASGRAMLLPGVPLPPPSPGSEAMRIGIIDSGILADHPQLRTLVVAQKAFAGADPVDRLGHGTLVALQAIRAHGDPEAQRLLGDRFSYPALLIARVTDDAGVPTVKAVIDAIDWVTAEGAKVVNLSLGFRGEAAEYTELCAAIARHPEVFFAAAAGNFGPDVKVFPAACDAPNLMSVGEVRGGAPTASSGHGDIYAPTDLPFLAPWQYHLEEGNRAARAGAWQDARRHYQLSLSDQANADALFELALLDIHDQDLEQAYQRLKQAVELAPELALLHAHLGAVRFMQTRYPEAEAHLRDALALDATEQMAHFNLGQTLLQLGRPADALSVFEQLQHLNPDYQRLDAAIAETRSRIGAAP